MGKKVIVDVSFVLIPVYQVLWELQKFIYEDNQYVVQSFVKPH